ncbi:MAG: VWA domain-containing protein, partial [Pirellulales bacterium]|nr:VWA domain-containing protein [Pirellulales bacterium]
PTVSPPRLFSWSASLVVHAGLLAGMLYLLSAPQRDPADDLMTSPVNIVMEQWVDEPMDDEETENLQDLPIGESRLTAIPVETETLQHDTLTPPTSTTVPHKPKRRSQERGEAATESGGKVALRLFGNEAQGSKFVFLFDRSISMEGPPLRAAKSQLVAGLRGLEAIHQFQIVFFNHEPQLWEFPADQPRLVAATTTHRKLAEAFVRGIDARGGTYRRSALLRAIGLRAEVIYFLTDADAPMAGNDILETVRLARRYGTAIHTIEFGILPHPTRENFLVQLARYTGGRYVYVNMNELSRTQE